MGLIDYMQSQKISAAGDWSFQSLVMAAMRKADDGNLAKLEQAFPETLVELRKRYSAPGGALTDQEMEFIMRQHERTEESTRLRFTCPRCGALVEAELDEDGETTCPNCENTVEP